MIVKGWKGEDVVILCGCGHEPAVHRNVLLFGQAVIGCACCACEATPMQANAEAGLALRIARSLGILPPVGHVAPKLCSCGLALVDGQCPVPEAHG